MTRLPPDFTLLQVLPALDTGGVEQTTLDVTAAVTAAGARALVASRGGRLERELHARGGELVRLPLDRKSPLALMSNALALTRLIARERVSLVHVRSRAPAFSALWAARRAGVPTVTTYHGVYKARSPLKRWYNGVMTRSDLVIANSNFTRDHLLAEHAVDPARVIAIPRGVDLAVFDPKAVEPERVQAVRSVWGLAAGDERRVVLVAGRLTRWKGQALMIQALQALDAQGKSGVVLILAGDDQGRAGYRAELERAAAAAGLAEQVRIVGHCADMPAAYLAADLVAAPSLEPEAFGRTAVEPQAMGRPVLTSDHGAARETVQDGVTGWLVRPGDAAAWAQALAAALAAGPERWRAMGEQGRARARQLYSVEAMTQATLNAYAELLEARRSPAAR